MVLICGEVFQNFLVVCLLEPETNIWKGHGKNFRVEAYIPKFLTIKTKKPYFKIKFKSSSNQIRTGRVQKTSKTAWVVSCNNKHTIRPCTIWPEIANHPADILFHLGDQIYADRIYWRWWRYLSIIDPDKWELYKPDIQREYCREYYETWEPLCGILSHTSNIMIPDDHEIKDQAEMWHYLIAGAPAEEVSWKAVKELPGIVDFFMPEEPTHKCLLEKFLFNLAYEICQHLYLGLRITNKEHFDYFRNIEGVSIIMTERISQPFLGKSFQKNLKKFKPQLQSKILWLGGLPPCPIRPNFLELLIYRHISDVPDESYDKLYDWLFKNVPKSSFDSPNIILIGGDLHVGCSGWIHHKVCLKHPKKKIPVAKFHISSPSSGFPSSYMPKDSLDSTSRYRVKIDEYCPSDPNAVRINFSPFNSKHYFVSGTSTDCWQNALSTAFTFWT